MVVDPYDTAAPSAQRPAFQGESIGSLVLGAAIFGLFGFGLTWITTSPASQFAMWTLRVLAIAFALTIAVVFIAPRFGEIVRLLVIALAAVLLSAAGVWGLIELGLNNITGWLLLIMGVFDGMEIVRYIAARRAAGG